LWANSLIEKCELLIKFDEFDANLDNIQFLSYYYLLSSIWPVNLTLFQASSMGVHLSFWAIKFPGKHHLLH